MFVLVTLMIFVAAVIACATMFVVGYDIGAEEQKSRSELED